MSNLNLNRTLAALAAILFLIVRPAIAIDWPMPPTTEAQPLGNSYGEYQNYGGASYLHPGIDILRPVPQALALAQQCIGSGIMPTKAALDALHVALATVHGMDFLLTWNCAHIANAAIRPRIDELCWKAGHRPPVICTPLELMERNES